MTRHFLLLFLAIVGSHAYAQDTAQLIRQEAQKCADALVAGDYAGVVKYTHQRVVTAMGGKDAMMAYLKSGCAQMKAQGYTFKDVRVGEPEPTQSVGTWLISLVPQKIFMTAPKGQMEAPSYILGISEDAGKNWVFIDAGDVPKEQLHQIFPELNKLKLPETGQPTITAE